LRHQASPLLTSGSRFLLHAALQESGLRVFQRALDHLDATMIAAGEPRSTVGGARSRRATSRSGGGGDEAGSGGQSSSSSNSSRVLSSTPPGGGGPSGSSSPASTRALVAVAQQCSRLIFEMFYITDELLHYALKHEGFVGEFALRLANLVYSVVFRHEGCMCV